MKDTPVNRVFVRACCAELGLPIPEWARKQKRGRPRVKPEKPKRKPVERELPDGLFKKRGRPSSLTPEERKYKEKVYNHAYYMRVTKRKRKAARIRKLFGNEPVCSAIQRPVARIAAILDEAFRLAGAHSGV